MQERRQAEEQREEALEALRANEMELRQLNEHLAGYSRELDVENARLRQEVDRAAVMRERSRLARELHDSVTQQLYSLTLLAEGWRRLAHNGKLDGQTDYLAELGAIAQQALKEMRLLVHELRPSALEQDGLLGALHQRLEAVERRSGVEKRLLADDLLDLPSPIEEEMYGIIQEALNNALKHAAATTVTVRVGIVGREVRAEISDNGVGFEASASGRSGLGLTSMQERADKLGATLTIDSAPNAGTKVTLQVPISWTSEVTL